MHMEQEPVKFVFIGNHFIVDFVNTRKNVKKERTELLNGLSDLMRWLEFTGKQKVVSGSIDSLQPARQKEIFQVILSFRSRLEHAFEQIVHGQIPASFIEELNQELAEYSGHYQLELQDSSVALVRHYTISQLPALFLEEAAAFLASFKSPNLKKCENTTCILYFYDTSRNQKRRWCSMEKCGNRVKVNQHYHRKKSSV